METLPNADPSETPREYELLASRRATTSLPRNHRDPPGPAVVIRPSRAQALVPMAAGASDTVLPAEIAGGDEALALRFAETCWDRLQYCAAWGKWLVWDGRRWLRDDTLGVEDEARALCREAGLEAASGIRIVQAIERLARSDRRLGSLPEQWDADPWLLNTPAGALDLKTGALRDSRADDYVTCVTAVAPGGECPEWQRFLGEITRGDAELERYLQRLCGYLLTGSTVEHALFFGLGSGANGKSVFLNTVAGILGDYARWVPAETFLAGTGAADVAALAAFHGARLVAAQEPEGERRWAEGRIKALAAGDALSLRRRQEWLAFSPRFKLVLMGNRLPSLAHVDNAIRRRFHVIPFALELKPQDRDPWLFEKLRPEWPGILAWMIRGSERWQVEGLGKPAAVEAASEDYLVTQDRLGRWLDECCILGRGFTATHAELFQSWQDWAKRNGEVAYGSSRFTPELKVKGFNRIKTATGNSAFVGLALRYSEESGGSGRPGRPGRAETPPTSPPPAATA